MGNLFTAELEAEKEVDSIPDLAVVPMVDLTTDPYCSGAMEDALELVMELQSDRPEIVPLSHQLVSTEKKLTRVASKPAQTEVRRCKTCRTGIPDRKPHQEYCYDCYKKTQLPTMRACAMCKRKTVKQQSSFLVCYDCTRAK